MRKSEILSILSENGYELMEDMTIINGCKLFFDNGAIISILNDEHVTLSGQSQELVAEMLGLNDDKAGGAKAAVAEMLAEDDENLEDDDAFRIDMGPSPVTEPVTPPTPAPAVASSAPPPPPPPTPSPTGNKVLLSCGSDDETCAKLEGMLRHWGMEPMVLNHLENPGQTMIEKMANLSSEVCFGIVIASPDDEGYRVGHPDEVSHRARQNVVLEMGMLLNRLGRKRVAILLKHQEDMERPSDIQGLNYIPYFDDIEKDAGTLLEKEIRAFAVGVGV